jgi:beta-lactamase class A
MNEGIRISVQAIWRYRSHIILTATGIAVGFLSAPLFWDEQESGQFAIREYDQRYEFIRPLLICQTSEDAEAEEFNSLKRQVDEVISAARKAKKLTTISVYFRDLNSGRWIGINELEMYSPASLLKVPVMMAHLKKAEERPEALQIKYRYTKGSEEDDPLIQKPLLVDNHMYTAFDLIRGMIIQSDNVATQMLETIADQSILEETYGVLELKNPYDTGDELYQLSAKKYALFFRALYNSTFLNREMSNQALELLSESEFSLGLRAGTPTNIKVAHKHGVRGIDDEDGSHIVEVSDCGIVYDPSSPYLLCVMSRGTNAYVLSDVIREIAEVVYSGVVVDQTN